VQVPKAQYLINNSVYDKYPENTMPAADKINIVFNEVIAFINLPALLSLKILFYSSGHEKIIQ